MAEASVQLKVTFRAHLHALIEAEAEAAGVTKASVVKMAVAERYREVLVLPDDVPVPYRMTEKGQAAAKGS